MAISSLTLAFVEGVKRRGAPCPAPHIFRFNSHPSFCAGHAGYVNNDDLEYHRILLLRETQEKSFKFRETGGGGCYNHNQEPVTRETTRVES